MFSVDPLFSSWSVARAHTHRERERERERSQPHLRLAPAMRPAGDRNVTESLTLEECELPRPLLQLERLLRQQGVLPRLHGSPIVSSSPLRSRLPSDTTASCRPPATVARQDQGHRSPTPTISTTSYAPQAVPILALLLFCPLARASHVPKFKNSWAFPSQRVGEEEAWRRRG